MSNATLSIPLFDADNHLYETREAFTKYLPERYQGAIDYVDVHGRTKIVVRGGSATTSRTPPSTSWPGPGRRRTTSGSATPTARAGGRSSASP